MIKVLIADDHSVVREGLNRIVADDPALAIVGEADNGHELVEKVANTDCDVAVIDITMPGPDILDVIKQLKKIKPVTQILVLSIHPENQYAFRVLKAGASGYLTKQSAPDELQKAIHKVADGGRYVSESLAEKLLFAIDKDYEKPPHENLSDREYQVLCMIASGKSVSGIARELNLSEKTISTYRARLLQKMQLKTNSDLTHYAFENGLVQ